MNRSDGRRLKRVANKALKHAIAAQPGLEHPAPASVTLVGGPMNGWIVKPDAPSLAPDWCLSWPPSVAAKHKPGMYVLEAPARARWDEL